MKPDLGVVCAHRAAVRLDRFGGSPPQRLKDLKDARKLVRVQVLRHGRTDHLGRFGAQQPGHAGVHIDDVHVGPDARDTKRGVADDLVQQVVAARQLGLCSLALHQEGKRVTMREDLARDHQDAYAGGEHGAEPVEVLVDQREPDGGDRGGQHGDPGERELPQLDRAFRLLLGGRAGGP